LAEYNRVKGFMDYTFNLPYEYALIVYRSLSALILCTITDPTIYAWFGFHRVATKNGREHIVAAPFVGVPSVLDWINTGLVAVDLVQLIVKLVDFFAFGATFQYFYFGKDIVQTITAAVEQTIYMINV
jgi:hypothetical protein